LKIVQAHENKIRMFFVFYLCISFIVMLRIILKALLLPSKPRPVGRWQVGGNWKRRAQLASIDA